MISGLYIAAITYAIGFYMEIVVHQKADLWKRFFHLTHHAANEPFGYWLDQLDLRQISDAGVFEFINHQCEMSAMV